MARSLILKRFGQASQCVTAAALRRSAAPAATYPAASSSLVIYCRFYISRAHPEPTPVVAVPQALEETLDGARQRRRRRQRKWKRNEKKKQASTTTTTTATASATATACSHPDETIDLALNLNLDPRKPGQSLRGSISLPNGTGKKLSCLVFTKDPEAQKRALAMGARHAGGESLVNALLQKGAAADDALGGEASTSQSDSDVVISLDSLDRVLASQDMIPLLSKTVARLLGPRGLMPNAKTGTVFSTSESLLESLETQIAGKEVVYRTERAGVVHVPIGKTSFGVEKLLENIGQVMVEIYKVKPEQYGKQSSSKKKSSSSSGGGASKNAKYLLSAYLSATQGKSIKLDVRTIDPASSFFLRAVEAPGAAAARAVEMKKEQEQAMRAAAAAAESTPVESSSSSTEQAKL
jgi:large subunit ribosomal protein L1